MSREEAYRDGLEDGREEARDESEAKINFLSADNARLRALLAEAIKQLAILLCRSAGHDPFNPTEDIYAPDDADCIFPWAGYRNEAERLLSESTPPVPRPLFGSG